MGLKNYLDAMIMKGHSASAVRAHLDETLHAQRASLGIGTACAVATAWACALLTGSTFLWALAAFTTFVSVIRLGVGLWYAARPGASDKSWARLFDPVTAFAHALCTGLIAAYVLWLQPAAHVQVLAIAFAMVTACGVTARSAGRPFVAFGQLSVVVALVVGACLLVATPGLLLLALMLPLMAVALSAVTMQIFRVLAEQSQMAEECRRMVELNVQQAHEDAVTGLFNRAGLEPALAEMIANTEKDGHVALIWLDLHRFKEVNDALGHAMGDKMLREMAQRLTGLAPEGSAVARFGSDEYILAAPLHSRTAVERLASQVCETLAQPVRIEGQRIESAASIGVAMLPEDACNAQKLMQAADLALFHAKSAGRHQVRFFDEGMTRALVRRKAIEAELRAAIQRDELSIFFQPIIDLETGRIRTFEALVRWFHPEKGELTPDEFIPVAEDSGLIITLGNWITAQAARAAVGWPEEISLAINLSPTQIRAPGAALGILAALRDAKLDPHRVELEVTEHLFLQDDEQTALFMQQLSEEGVRFALDDFGTGYSALHYINKYPFKTIKVDRSFVSGPDVGRRSDAIIRAVAEMGATLDMEIVAEGLETIDQVQFVKDAGCTLGQGFYFSRAVPDYLAAMLLAHEDHRLDDVQLVG